MAYSDADVQQMGEAIERWRGRLDNLTVELVTRVWPNDRSREYAIHGFLRRTATLTHCMDRTFEVIPPQAGDLSKAAMMDASAFIQTFYINIYGAFDNLAHLWVAHRGIVRRDGSGLRRGDVGFNERQRDVWRSLPEEVVSYLTELREWREYFKGYRDALAHRIPLYMPPKTLNRDAVEVHQALGREIEAAWVERRVEDVNRLMDQQSRLGVFEPLIQHSYGERAQPIRFHAQMVCDFSTLVEFATKLIPALD